MTYNFDPDRWREDNLARLDLERKEGKLAKADYERAVEDIERRYEQMVTRIDHTYQVRKETRSS